VCKADTLEGLNDSGVIGIIRVSTAQGLIRIAKALHEGDFPVLRSPTSELQLKLRGRS